MWLHEALEILVRIGDENCSARTNSYLARIAIEEEDYKKAEAYLKESLDGYKKLDRKIGIATCLLRYVELAQISGQNNRASRLLGAISVIAEDASSFYSSVWLKEYEELVEIIKYQLGDPDFQAGFGEGVKLEIEQAVALAQGKPSYA